MPLLKAEAQKLSNNQLVAGVIEEIIYRDEVFARLPFIRTDGKAYVYNRENTIGTVDFYDPYDNFTESAADFTQVTTNLRVFGGDVYVDKFMNGTMSDTNNQRALQIQAKAKAMGIAFKTNMIIGDNAANAKQFDGLRKLVTVPQTISAGTNGAALTLSMLDDLLTKVPNQADAILMRRTTANAVRALYRSLGGALPETAMLSEFGNSLLTHNGIPILESDYLPAGEAQGTAPNTTSIYAVRFGGDGLSGLYGGPDAGMVVESVGTHQTKDSEIIRLKWYAGMVLHSTRSVARLQGITNV